jgi:hypothetical protein
VHFKSLYLPGCHPHKYDLTYYPLFSDSLWLPCRQAVVLAATHLLGDCSGGAEKTVHETTEQDKSELQPQKHFIHFLLALYFRSLEIHICSLSNAIQSRFYSVLRLIEGKNLTISFSVKGQYNFLSFCFNPFSIFFFSSQILHNKYKIKQLQQGVQYNT